MNDTKRVSFKEKGITDVDIESFEVMRTNGLHEDIALDLAARKVPATGDQRLFRAAAAEARVALSVVKVNDKEVNQATFPEEFAKYSDRTRAFMQEGWTRLNGVKQSEVDRLFS